MNSFVYLAGKGQDEMALVGTVTGIRAVGPNSRRGRRQRDSREILDRMS